MDLLAMVAALWLLQVWGTGGAVQRDEWYRSWQSTVGRWSLGPPWRLALAIAVPMLVVVVVLDALRGSLFGLLWIAAATAVLLYAFGRGDYRALMDRYRSYCRSADFEGAWLAAESEWGLVDAPDAPASAQEAHRALQRGLYYTGFQRWFAVLFYFALFGPAAALGYRLLHLSKRGEQPALATRVLHYLDWIPARLLAAVFAVTGDFVRCKDALVSALGDFGLGAGAVLQRVGDAALGGAMPPDADDEQFGAAAATQNMEMESLLKRSAVVWIVGAVVIELFQLL